MAENKTFEGFTEEELAQYGYSAGRAVAVLVDSFIQGLADGRAELAAHAAGIELVNDGDEEPELKTDIQDCRRCWCDTCGRLEECQKHREGTEPDGLRPLPCIGCVNGLRFKPKEKRPCADYLPIDGNNNG